MMSDLALAVFGIAGDDNKIAGLYEMSSHPVDTDFAGTWFTGNRISRQTCSFDDIKHVDLLEIDETRGFHQVSADGNAALVIELSISAHLALSLRFGVATVHL